MANEDILEKQIEALEKLLQLRAALIEELEAKISRLEAEKYSAPQYPGISVPWVMPTPWIGQPSIGGSGTITISNTCPDGTPHNYPSFVGGLLPPTCTKCGAYQSTTVLTNTSQADPNDPNNVFTLTNVAK